MRGLRVDVYKFPLGECTNNGITSRHRSVALFDERGSIRDGNLRPRDVQDDEAVMIVRHDKEYLGGFVYAVPARVVDGVVVPVDAQWMHGGNLLSTSDSRFRERYGCALPAHDRTETAEQSRRLSL
jgi:hypothetical protein